MSSQRSFYIFKRILSNLFKRELIIGEPTMSLQAKALEAETLTATLRQEILDLQKLVAVVKAANNDLTPGIASEALKKENEKLREEIAQYKKLLTNRDGNSLITNTGSSTVVPTAAKPVEAEKKSADTEKKTDPKPAQKKPQKENQKEDGGEKPKKKSAPAAAEEPPIDVGRLDLRVGKIVDVQKHPDADSLYLEQIDVGEGKPLTVVSGLVKFVPIEEMQGRLVVVLCNLKPAKMRGITSEAMVMCASTPEKVEVLSPPPNSVPGDLIHVEGYPRLPDPVLNPKKKIFEAVAPDLKTDTQKIATFKGAPWTVPGKGVVSAKTLTGVNVK